jgi:hypothetical protein
MVESLAKEIVPVGKINHFPRGFSARGIFFLFAIFSPRRRFGGSGPDKQLDFRVLCVLYMSIKTIICVNN